jgi:hypothetical protein
MSPIHDIAFMRYTVTNLDSAQSFLADFGLHTVAHTVAAFMHCDLGPQWTADDAAGPGAGTDREALTESARATGSGARVRGHRVSGPCAHPDRSSCR